MPKFKFHKLAAIIVLIGFAAWVATGAFSSVGGAAGEDKATQTKADAAKVDEAPLRVVKVIVPPRGNHARAIRISGLTEADKRAVLATRVGGVIAELPVKQGERVKTGDMVLMLDAEEKVAAVDNAKQVLVQRQAEIEASERLAKSGNLAKLQLDTARSSLSAAKSQLEAAEAELARNEVKAPFDGIIDRVDVELGSAVMQGGEVATIISLDPIIARGEVSERDVGYIKIGDKAKVRLVNDQIVEGTVRYISRDASSATRTFRLEVAIDNPDRTIPAGMTAEISLSAQSTEAIVLPRSVVTLGDKGDLGIRAVNKDDVVVFYPIDLVDDKPSGLVLAGIPAGTRVIIAGQQLVAEGDKVKPVEADPEEIRKLVGDVAGGTL